MIPIQTTAGLFAAPGSAEVFLLARLLFGGVLAFMGLNHFLNAEEMVPYAEAKGVPVPGLSVPLTGALLVLGGLSLVLGVFPLLGAGALALFLLGAAVLMHDFWARDGQAAQDELVHFLKNVALASGALGFLALSGVAWPYSLGVGLL